MIARKIYNGWYFAGRPALEELRLDPREIMSEQSCYAHEAWKTPERRPTALNIREIST